MLRSAVFSRLFIAVVAIQGIHVLEHVIQLAQVYLLGVADDDALGLLGWVFAFQLVSTGPRAVQRAIAGLAGRA